MMKKQLTFSRLLHKDKLMMVVSLILAIIIWAAVDYEQGYTYELSFSNVPVTVKLSDYAEKNGLRVVKGDNIKATVRVSGTRSVLKSLSADDIVLTAEAESILYDGRYKVSLLPTVAKKCDIVEVSGKDIMGSRLQDKSVWIECSRFVDKDLMLTSKENDLTLSADQVKMPNLTWDDGVELAAIVLDDDAVKDGKVTINGPQTVVSSIKRVGLVISETKTMSQTERFMAALKAYDEKGQEIKDITYKNPRNGEVGVVIRVITYRTEDLSVTSVLNRPNGMKDDRLTVTPQRLVLGEVSGEKSVLDSYVENIRKSLTVDFDQLLPGEEDSLLVKTIPLVEQSGIYFGDQSVKAVSVSLNVDDYGHRNVTIPLSQSNVVIVCDAGYEATWNQKELKNVVLCGPKYVLNSINPESIIITIDAREQEEGSHTVAVRPQIGSLENGDDFAWIYYGDDGYSMEYAIVKSR